MFAQIVVQTNAHPYHIQVISFFASVAPALIVLTLILAAQVINLRRNYPHHLHQ